MKHIDSPKNIKEKFPLSPAVQEKIDRDRQEIKDIISGKDDRKILIIGPCSAWPDTAVLEYAGRLQKLSEKVSDRIKIVMRAYSQKPRTTKGWSGPLFQPDPFGKSNVQAGIEYVRKTMISVLEIGLPIADEALFLESGAYLNDLYAYVALGARSSEDHAHRVYASALDFAVGVKNPTSGDLGIAKKSVLAVQGSHAFLANSGEGFAQVDSSGNTAAHLILRGGSSGPNYGVEHIAEVFDSFAADIHNPAVVIDLNHNNSGKDPGRQPEILDEVFAGIARNTDLNDFVKGFMVESYIHEGNQNIDDVSAETCVMDGLSITDGCLGWEASERLVLDLYEILV